MWIRNSLLYLTSLSLFNYLLISQKNLDSPKSKGKVLS